ncbi:MAG TPA: M56 family metallopeptidase [Melioribacteraceae bacterium]|nr:M56 family metallopeptidase [Melioribacteraceae bacterium]
MNFIYNLIPENFIEAVGLTIFHSIWQGLIISLVLGIALSILQKKNSRLLYKISVAALLFFVICSMATFSEVYSTDKNPGPGTQSEETRVQVLGLIEIENETESGTSYVFSNIFNESKSFFDFYRTEIFFVWIAGLLFFSFRFAGGVIYVQRLRGSGVNHLPDFWDQKIKSLSARAKINRPVSVLESVLVNVPVAIGYFKPLILLPIGILAGIPHNQVEAIIAHELAHIKRYDFLVNLFQSLAEAIFFYHPAVWWISSIIRRERENCCDDIALQLCGDTVLYSNALLNIQEFRGRRSTLVLAANGNGKQLYRRIKRMNGKTNNRLSYGIKFAAFAALIILLAVASLYSGNSFANLKGKTNYASFFNNPIEPEIDNNSNTETYPNFFSAPDTSGLKKGKRTLRFTEKENGERIRYKARLEDGKLISLSINGEKVPDNELNRYESKIQKKFDEYEYELQEYKKNKEEYQKIARDYKEKMKELRDKMKDLQKDNFDFDFEFDIPQPDLSELREAMKDLRNELKDGFADHSFVVPPIHIPKIEIPPIHIPPVPPIAFDEEEWDQWKDDLKNNMEEFREKMKEHKWNMGEFNENMKGFNEKMKEFSVEMKKFGAFIKEMKAELVVDGIIGSDDEIDELVLSEDKMEVNGKRVSADLHKKYKDLYEKHTGKKIEGKNKIRIND